MLNLWLSLLWFPPKSTDWNLGIQQESSFPKAAPMFQAPAWKHRPILQGKQTWPKWHFFLILQNDRFPSLWMALIDPQLGSEFLLPVQRSQLFPVVETCRTGHKHPGARCGFSEKPKVRNRAGYLHAETGAVFFCVVCWSILFLHVGTASEIVWFCLIICPGWQQWGVRRGTMEFLVSWICQPAMFDWGLWLPHATQKWHMTTPTPKKQSFHTMNLGLSQKRLPGRLPHSMDWNQSDPT